MADDLPDAPWISGGANLPDAPWATAAPTPELEPESPRPTAHQRMASVRQQIASEPSDVAAGFSPVSGITPPQIPQEPNPLKNPATVAIGKGIAKGVPASLSGGMLGDIEGTARLAGRPFGLSQKTVIPQTVEGGYLGPRGLGLMNPPTSPQEEGGMLFGSMLAPGAAGKLKDLAAGAGAQTLGLTTGAGPEAFKIASGAGYEGGEAAQAFRGSMRGTEPMGTTVDAARTALQNLRNERGAAYKAGMQDVASDPTVLDFDKINNAYANVSKIKQFKGQDLSPSTVNIRNQLRSALDDWQDLDPKEFHTAEGMDALKQKIGDIRDATQYGTPERVMANGVYGAVRQTIVDQAPQYAKVMGGYEKASDQLKEIERTLSLNPNATVDTSLRKLQSTLRDNVNTSYGQRRVLADYLVNAGAPNLMERLAGQTLQPWAARGLGRLGMQLSAEMALAGIGMAHVGAPGLAAAAVGLPFMSPRLMGEAAYYAGRAASPLKYAPPGTKAGLQAAPIGAEVNREQHKTGGRVNKQKGLATKHQANYRGGNSRNYCAICTMFVKPSSCTSVRGHISPRGLCDFFERKGDEK